MHTIKKNIGVPYLKEFFFILSLLKVYSIFPQTSYLTNTDYIKKKTEQNNLLSQFKNSYPDSSINNLSYFFDRNFMGNIGLPSPEYVINCITPDIGFKLLKNPQNNNLFKEKDVEYLQTKGPFASLSGISGTKQLQIFKMQFTNTFKNKLNINIRFNRYGSVGFYLKQQTFINNFYTSSNYTSKKKRWGYYGYIFANATKTQNNGGIKQDTLGYNDIFRNKDLFAVNITAATTTNKEYKAMFNPWIKLNKLPDSVLNYRHFLQLKSKFNLNSYKYKDDNSGTNKYYNLFYLDTVKTVDSTAVLQAINDINYSVIKSNLNFGASVGYRNEINKVWQKADSLFYNNLIIAELVFRKPIKTSDSTALKNNFVESSIHAAYIFSGANNGNYKIESKSILNFKKEQSIFFNALYEKRNADYIYNYWVSNHFQWFNNGFKPQETLKINLGYNFKNNLSLGVIYENVYNYLLFDNTAYPRQYNNNLNTVSFNAGYTLILLKHLGIYVNEIYQTTSNTSYINIPQNISTARIFYTGNLFKNNLQLQFGSQCQYFSTFYGAGYMPSTQVFYLQDRFKTGNYIYTDVYLNARIRPVQFFIKVENVLQGFAGNNYSLMPGYYQPDRAFRFGITWLFFD